MSSTLRHALVLDRALLLLEVEAGGSVDQVPFESVAHRTTSMSPGDEAGVRVARNAAEWAALWNDIRGGQPPPECPPDPAPRIDWGRHAVLVASGVVPASNYDVDVRRVTADGGRLRVEAVEREVAEMGATVMSVASHAIAIAVREFDSAELVVDRGA